MATGAGHTCAPSGAGVLMPRDGMAWTKDRVDRENCQLEQTCICVHTLSAIHLLVRIQYTINTPCQGCCSWIPLCRHNPSYASVRHQLAELHTLTDSCRLVITAYQPPLVLSRSSMKANARIRQGSLGPAILRGKLHSVLVRRLYFARSCRSFLCLGPLCPLLHCIDLDSPRSL